LADRPALALQDLEHAVLGVPHEDLFPAWSLTQQQALEAAGITPPTVRLEATDLAASGWAHQQNVEWVLLTASLSTSHRDTVIRPVEPEQLAPYTLQWSPDRAQTAAVARFVHLALSGSLPAGWATLPGHLGHDPA
jgi:aminoglycoside phosphotransferase (APT) family kinase protein